MTGKNTKDTGNVNAAEKKSITVKMKMKIALTRNVEVLCVLNMAVIGMTGATSVGVLKNAVYAVGVVRFVGNAITVLIAMT